ncbi:MAG TPA: hypothetical protein VGQ12_07250 [Candidatus Angelobacter sp.]|jgi:hypothetical protein|nr:hypothetical protein [Candidatus Angelobacter sp.]
MDRWFLLLRSTRFRIFAVLKRGRRLKQAARHYTGLAAEKKDLRSRRIRQRSLAKRQIFSVRSRPRPIHAERPASRAEEPDIKNTLERLSPSGQNDEKAVRQQDGLLFQGRIVPTEFEKDHQNFLAKSYWPVKGSVKGFLENKCFCFQWFSNLINMHFQMAKNVISRVSIPVNNSFSAT